VCYGAGVAMLAFVRRRFAGRDPKLI